MHTSSTSVLERRVKFSGELTTHQFEVGWASEAVFFVQLKGNTSNVTLQPYVSPDGLNWVAFGGSTVHKAGTPLSYVDLARYGSWLRLSLVQDGTPHEVEALVHLTLKG